MKESRQRQLLEGQSSVARKVFEGVPIQEAWTENEIVKAMRTGGMTVGTHTVRAALLDMKDAGLIKEPRKGQFQREPVQPYLRLSTEAPTETVNPTPASEPSMPTTNATTLKPAPTPLDMLGAIAVELTLMSSEFGNRLKGLAARLEEVALSVEAQRETDAAAMAKVHQLKALLSDVVGQ